MMLENYLKTLTSLRGATVPETAYYAALQTLLNEIGGGLRPKVYAIIHPRDSGAGLPDLGLFDENQPNDQKPARGIVEAKPVSADLLEIARGEQVARYVAHYGQALVTNYYQFVLVTRDEDGGEPHTEERYDLAENASAFWETAAHPRKLAQEHEIPLRETLMRMMRRNASLSSPQDVAWILASYAREAKARIGIDTTSAHALSDIRQQLEAALGVRFEDETAEEFFQSTLVQTLFYGVFSAWVLWHEHHPQRGATFDLWRDTRRLNVPVIQELFEKFSAGSALPKSVEEVLEWTVDALNRVDRTAFFERFNKGDAIQYFYEPFLEAFDPDLRRQLGVWYTPPEVVDYMVARVDAALKDELGIADGLADPNVYVLDPCCGTGAYLVSVLRRVYETAKRRDGEALAGQTVQAAMRERVFGFEILPAPFVVAHLQIGMLLNDYRAPLATGQRAGVYLTNALTGWDTPDAPRMRLMFPELQKEREAADTVKREREILVILGNPPYSGFAGVAVEEERALTDAYRTVNNPALPRPQGQGLNDLYVRFYRMAERRIAEQTGRGVVSFISNYSWLDGLSHPGMRERYLEVFDSIYVDNLHGDRIISEYAPDGRTSETVFAMRGSSTGIRIGTAITTMVRKPSPPAPLPQGEGSKTDGGEMISRRNEHRATLYYRDMDQARADERRAALLESLKAPDFMGLYTVVKPAVELGLPLKPRLVGADYFAWPKLTELFPASFPGVQSKRDEAVVDIDKDRLIARMEKYFDPTISHDEMKRVSARIMEKTHQMFFPIQTREELQKRGFKPEYIIRYCYRPFDLRWIYYEMETNLIHNRSPSYFPHVQPDNFFIVSQQRPRRDWSMPQVIRSTGCLDLMDRSASCIPLYLYDTAKAQPGLFERIETTPEGRRANISDLARGYLEALNPQPEQNLTPQPPLQLERGSQDLFYHALAVLHSPAYRVENAGALRQDWPRVPLPKSSAALMASAALGRDVAALLDVETPVAGVTQGEIRPALLSVAVLATVDGSSPNLKVNARWGYLGQGSAVMPGQGKMEQRETADGSVVYDIYLNETMIWRGVPLATWEYTLGGYQVLKKWLSYRETTVLGRPLTVDDVREFMHIARRITALLMLNEALDANYRAVVV